MRLRLLHRRLAVLMCFAGLLAFAGGAGFEPVSGLLVMGALMLALFWHPSRALSARMERIWLPLAVLLVIRALIHVFVIKDDVVIPVVDLLLMLMAAEALRSLDAPNDIRLYSLSFALVLASTAYRPGILFLVAFVAYIALAVVALMAGHLRRQAERYGSRDIPLGRRMIATTLGLSSVIFLVAAIVFVTFPRVSRGWSGRGRGEERTIAGFGNEVSIGAYGARIYANPAIALRVEFPEGRPASTASLHWKGRSYDHFDGVRWSRSRGLPPSAAPPEWYRERWTGPVVTQKIYAAALDVHVLFGIHPVLGVEPEQGIQPLSDNAGDLIYWGSGAPSYTVFSRDGEPTPAELRGSTFGYSPSQRYYLQLPADLDPRIPALADSLTRGLTTAYDKAVAIERWLHTFRYTVELPATARDATLAHFLFVRKAGHCEYFSTAMVVLLRTLGIEARNVDGFLGGEWSNFGNYLVVTENQAHSWVEVWFPQYGWVTFDPTPPAGDVSAGGKSWLWPGRLLLDGIQHRWEKWVLDYNARSQAGLFERWSGRMAERSANRPTGHTGLPEGGEILVVLLVLSLVAVGFAWARHGVAPEHLESRIYLRLRESCRRAGVRVTPGLTPLALVERVRLTHRSATVPVERVVDLYLRSRYGGEALGESEKREMRRALAVARRSMREEPKTHGVS